jgi:hypothetical protein
MRQKYLIRGINISPKKLLGIIMLIHLFPLICFANAMTVGDFTPTEAFAMGYLIDIIFLGVGTFFYFAFKLLD